MASAHKWRPLDDVDGIKALYAPIAVLLVPGSPPIVGAEATAG